MSDRDTFTKRMLELNKPVNQSESPSIEVLLAQIYDELRLIAGSYLRSERSDHTLQPTALVHEAYSRLVDQTQIPWSDASHFRAITAKVMRQVLIDHARKHSAIKRGGDRIRVTLSEIAGATPLSTLDLLDLDEALISLRSLDERKAQVVELLFFGGMTHKEAANVVGVSQKNNRS